MADSNAAKIAATQAIIANGSQGPAMLKAQAASPSSTAVNMAAQRAGAINAPADFLKQQATQISEPFQTAGALNSSNNSALNSYIGALTNAHGNYMNELNAALPLYQDQLNKDSQNQSVNQVMQLLQMKNTIDNDNYTKSQRDLSTANANTQQDALNSVLQNSNPYVKNQAIQFLSPSGDLSTTLTALNDPKVQAEFKKNGADIDAFRNTVIQYYNPTSYNALQKANASAPASAASPAAATAQAAAPAPTAASVLSGLQSNPTLLGLPSDPNQTKLLMNDLPTGPATVSAAKPAKGKLPWWLNGSLERKLTGR